MGSLADHVRRLAEPVVDAEQLELVDVEQRGSGGAQLVRVLVDADGGVDLAACERVSRRLDAALEDVEELQDRYRLEVSSPGVHRPLRDRRAFERVTGRDVTVTRGSSEGRTEQLVGVVRRVDDAGVVLEVASSRGTRRGKRADHTVTVRFDEIVTAKQALPW